MPAADAKQKIVPVAETSGIDGFALKELSEGIDNYFCDRERRHRLRCRRLGARSVRSSSVVWPASRCCGSVVSRKMACRLARGKISFQRFKAINAR
jgi:hypothetical protein